MPRHRSTRSPSVEIQHVQPVKGNKRRRASTASTPGSRRSARIQAAPRPQIILDSEDSEEELFVTQPKKLKFDTTADSDEGRRKPEQAPEDDDVIDLADPAPPAPAAPAKHPGRVEFAAFQCAICMDNATALAVTHCGHLFCSECLQSALTTETTRNKCPICRQKVETRERDTYNAKTKGFWHLELKPMTATKKGKQAAK